MNEFERIPTPLIAWYRENKRDLPWRINPTPYRVWVSEIMLQQTRVEAAKEYYLRFLSALPTVQDLAAAGEEKLLKLWEGLGYYSRVRNMQKAAKTVVEEYGGNFPSDEKLLRKLSGIGDYTAGAISSIAFLSRTAAVDGNVMRVLSRYAENETDISDPKYKQYLKEKLEEIYPEQGVACSDFTQALMELGALVCTPMVWRCESCPLKGECKARANGTQEKFPVLPQKKAKKKEKLFVFLIRTPQGIAVRKRETGVLKGMNEFPSEKADRSMEEILSAWGMAGYKVSKRKKFTHVFTHIEWDMDCVLLDAETSPFHAYTREQLEKEIALPTAFKQCLKIIQN